MTLVAMGGNTARVLVIATLALVVLLQTIPEGGSECCWGSNGLCADGGPTTPCCGNGKCNIFCCNCDGGCRRRFPETPADRDAQDVIAKGDKDGDGVLNMPETLVLMATKGFLASRVKREFRDMDANNDNVLSADEIDPDSSC